MSQEKQPQANTTSAAAGACVMNQTVWRVYMQPGAAVHK